MASKYSEPEHEVHFSWKLDPWFILWNGVENGEYYESPVFTTEEGYNFRAKVYLKGMDQSSAGHVSFEVEQVDDYEHDRVNVWPMIGKLITVGITEQGKSPAETAMVTKSDVTGVWGNPSEGDPNRLVWKDFVSHDHLFYDSRNPSGWDFVDHDSMMFTLSVTDATGVFVKCNGPSFGKCRFHQDKDDSFDWSSDGEITQRGVARVQSIPIHQWGPRCLVFTVETSASITVGVSGVIKYENDMIDYPYYRDRLHPIEQTKYTIYVNVGAEDFDTELQQRIKIEVVNHESVPTRFVSSEWYHGWCDDRFENFAADNERWSAKARLADILRQ